MQLEGSPAVEAANDKFSATMVNKVRWGLLADPGLLELNSDTAIQVSIQYCCSWISPGLLSFVLMQLTCRVVFLHSPVPPCHIFGTHLHNAVCRLPWRSPGGSELSLSTQ